jgi:UDP-glucuronate 4-epimerase
MEVVVLRFFTVYGPRQRPDLAIHAFARRIAARQPIQIFGDGSSARDYTYISDIVDGITACTRRTFGYEVFNLGGSNPTTLSRLVELVETAMGRKALVERKPNQPGDVPRTWADVSKSGRLLGYSPKVKIEEGIPLFVDWFRGLERSPVVRQS